MTNTRWRIVLWATMGLIVLWVAWQARGALVPFAIGAVLAYALSPVVDTIASWIPASTHRRDVLRRGLVVGVLYITFFGSLIGVGVAVLPTAVQQAGDFIEILPEIVEDARIEGTAWIDQFRAQLPAQLRDDIDRAIQDFSDGASDFAGHLLTGTVSRASGTIGLVAGIVIVPFWMFYALRDRHFVERNFLRATPAPAQDDVRNLGRMADDLFGRYIRAQLLLGLIVGVSVGIVMSLLGVEFAVGLGLWAGVTELIPILGPWLGAAAGLIVVLATDPGLFVWVALAYLVVQQLENNLLVPRIQGGAVDIHPAMVLLLLSVAGSIWGLAGLVVAVPIAAILRELFWYADRRLRGESPEEAFAHSMVGSRRKDLPLDATLDEPAAQAAEDSAVLEHADRP